MRKLSVRFTMNNLMENALQINSALSLKELTLHKVSLILFQKRCNSAVQPWNNYMTITKQERIDYIISKVKYQIHDLQLIPSLKNELETFINLVCFEIIKWVAFLDHIFPGIYGFFIDTLDALIWSSKGTINYKKTAENLVRQKHDGGIFFYQLSCKFCLEDDVETAWNNLCDEEKAFYGNAEELNTPSDMILHYWNNEPVNRFSSCFFIEAVTQGNLPAIQYFFSRFTNHRKYIIDMIPNLSTRYESRLFNNDMGDGFHTFGFNRDILDFLLTQLSFEEFIEIFQRNSVVDILWCYRDWHRQKKFFKILEQVKHLLPPEGYASLLFRIAREMNKQVSNYSQFFRELFLKSDFANGTANLMTQSKEGFFLTELFLAEDIENIVFVLRNVDSFTKEQIFISKVGFDFCLYLMLNDKWDLLSLFVNECKLSTSVKVNIPEWFALHLSEHYKQESLLFLKDKLSNILNMPSPTMKSDCSK